jgi:hypothetical protein
MTRTRRRSTNHHDERGVALAAAVAVAFIVVLLSTAAITQSINTITQAGIAGKEVSSTDAAEAGIQYEVNQINAQVAANATTFACPASPVSLASTGTLVATYSIKYSLAVGQTAPATATTTCASGGIPLTPGDTYLIQSTGTTSSLSAGSRTEQAKIYIPAQGYGQSTSFDEALYAGLALLGGGSFSLTGGDTYTGSVSACLSNWSFNASTSPAVGGNYYSAGAPDSLAGIALTVPTVFSGACSVKGNLYMNNGVALTITGGSGVGGNLYGTGLVTMAGGADVGGSLWANGLVTLNAGSDVGGSVYTTGGLTMVGGPVVSGNVYSNGPVTVNGTVTGNIYANGPVTVAAGATVGGTIYSTGLVSVVSATVHAIQSTTEITYVTSPSVGAVTAPLIVPPCGTLILANASSCSNATPTLPPAQFASGTGTIATIASTVSAQMVVAANAANGTPTGTSQAVPFPVYSYDSGSWNSNVGFCSATVACSKTTPGLRTLTFTGTATNNVCAINTVVSNGQTVLDPNSLWGVVASMTQAGAPPTVIQTNCQFTWGDSYLKGYSLPLCNSLAIFDSAGFTLPSSFSGFSSGTCGGTAGKHQLYLVVPGQNSPPLDGANVLPTGQSLLDPNAFPIGEATCNLLTGPDINISQPLTDSSDNISDFLYTPSNICSYTGNATIYGQVYAGATVGSTSNWNQTYANVSPFVSQAGGGANSVAGTPVVQVIQQASNPAGTT